jgi:ribosomal-protein-alanine N-acetyltransferase
MRRDSTENEANKFPCIETERLVLRELRREDAPALFEIYHNPEVMQYRGADFFNAPAQADELLVHFDTLFKTRTGLRWALSFRGAEETLLGTAGLNSIDRRHFRGVIGYELAPDYWNRGLMTEALKAIAAYAFHELKLHSLEANIAPANLASERVLQKLHFVKEAHYKENWYYKGWWDSVIYSLLNTE